MSNHLTYADYINIDCLLELQEPRTLDSVPMTRTCEHFFIVTHQASELWLNQVLLDIDEATAAVAQMRYPDAAECVHRCAAVLDVMAANLDVLATMPPGRFASFREELGQASGGQSRQFAQLDRRTGIGGRSPLLDSLLAACDREHVTLAALLRPGDPEHPDLAHIALGMLDMARKAWRWKVMHLELVHRMIGTRSDGTGGSTGTDYLAGRLRMPFQPLWNAVSEMQARTADPTMRECPYLAAETI